jgi:hypothetical protein
MVLDDDRQAAHEQGMTAWQEGQRMKWHHDNRENRWERTIGVWRASVRHIAQHDWYPYVERIYPPHDRYDGPRCQWAQDARTWCEEEITKLRVNNR